jgi:hypothetical protein
VNAAEKPRDEVVNAIHEIVEGEIGRYALERINIEVANDHDGEPSIWIATHHRPSTEPVQMAALARVISRIRERLLELGEERFPYVRYQFADDQRIAS